MRQQHIELTQKALQGDPKHSKATKPAGAGEPTKPEAPKAKAKTKPHGQQSTASALDSVVQNQTVTDPDVVIAKHKGLCFQYAIEGACRKTPNCRHDHMELSPQQVAELQNALDQRKSSQSTPRRLGGPHAVSTVQCRRLLARTNSLQT